MADLTADTFVSTLQLHASASERDKIAARMTDAETRVIGVRMKTVFDTAKAHADISIGEIEKLLDSSFYEARMGAVSIMDFRVRRKRVSDGERKGLFDLYLRKHDRINTWDFVDRAAPRVIGGYLLNHPRDVLFELAHSSNVWERRTAITAAFWLIRAGDLDDPLAIADVLLHDDEHFVQTSVGTALREAATIDGDRLAGFLDQRAPAMPSTTLRIATSKLPSDVRERLRAKRKR